MKQIWEKIKAGLKFIGKVQSLILLTLFYFLILGPVAILAGIFKGRKTSHQSYWTKRAKDQETKVTLLRQF